MLRRLLSRLHLRPDREASRLQDVLDSQYGHARTRRQRACVDRHGEPIPWYTYPAIEYLAQLDHADSSVFEFGSGNSTLFWGQRARNVVSVENDPDWSREVAGRIGRSPIELRLVEDLDDYAATIADADDAFDVIVVDGRRRYSCAREAISRLRPGGLIVLDNSDWYPNTTAMLRAAGLIQVDMSGFGPINAYTWTTSLFLDRAFRPRPLADRLPSTPNGGLVDYSDDDEEVAPARTIRAKAS
jgi:predicted O-methyltransferase YrrM